jgi:hypothetical protein
MSKARDKDMYGGVWLEIIQGTGLLKLRLTWEDSLGIDIKEIGLES